MNARGNSSVIYLGCDVGKNGDYTAKVWCERLSDGTINILGLKLTPPKE
jgi:hypothetical protein